MDKVKEFDKGLKAINKNAYMMSKVMTYLLCGIGFMFLLFPVGKEYERSDFWWVVSYAGFTCGMGEWFYLMAYHRVQEGKQHISVYKKLRYMPVTRTQIRKVRYKYLNSFCCKMGIAAFVLQETASLINHSFGWISVLAVLIWVAIMWAFGRLFLFFD